MWQVASMIRSDSTSDIRHMTYAGMPGLRHGNQDALAKCSLPDMASRGSH
jgi:hypothetical protein